MAKAAEMEEVAQPTPERLVKAKGQWDVPKTREKSRKVMRMRDYPLAHLFDMERIDKAQFEAGERFEAIVRACGFGGLKSKDLCQPFVEGGDGGTMARTENEAHARQIHRQAVQALGPATSRVVVAVAVERFPLEIVGLAVLGYKNRPQARAGAYERLCAGLDALVEHWRLGS